MWDPGSSQLNSVFIINALYWKLCSGGGGFCRLLVFYLSMGMCNSVVATVLSFSRKTNSFNIYFCQSKQSHGAGLSTNTSNWDTTNSQYMKFAFSQDKLTVTGCVNSVCFFCNLTCSFSETIPDQILRHTKRTLDIRSPNKMIFPLRLHYVIFAIYFIYQC